MPGEVHTNCLGICFLTGCRHTSVVSHLFRKPSVEWQGHFGLRVNSKTIGNPVDVVEIADNLSGHRNLSIIKIDFPQRHQVVRRHFSWRQCQLDGIVAQCSVGFTQISLAVVEDQLLSELRVSGLQTEVVCV